MGDLLLSAITATCLLLCSSTTVYFERKSSSSQLCSLADDKDQTSMLEISSNEQQLLGRVTRSYVQHVFKNRWEKQFKFRKVAKLWCCTPYTEVLHWAARALVRAVLSTQSSLLSDCSSLPPRQELLAKPHTVHSGFYSFVVEWAWRKVWCSLCEEWVGFDIDHLLVLLLIYSFICLWSF